MLFLRGLLIGLAIAAPVGPIGVLCIRQTLAYGWLTGLLAGLGAATADAVYGSIAAFGLSAISDFLVNQHWILKLVGGIFLCCLGVQTFRSSVAQAEIQDAVNHDRPRSLIRTYGSTLVLTLTNPTTILSFTAIFAGLGIASQGQDYQASVVIVTGVFSGSALWWLILTSGILLLHQRLTALSMVWINRISGIIITAFGVVAIVV